MCLDFNIEKDDQNRWNMERIIKYRFDECLYTKVGYKIVNMTFNKWYSDYLRVGINSYTLTPYRDLVFRPLWKEGGYMDMTHEKHKKKALGYFCSYFMKNNKLKNVIKMLKKSSKNRNFNFGGQASGWLSRFYIGSNNPIYFRNVFQYISYANNNGDAEANYTKLINLLKSLQTH